MGRPDWGGEVVDTIGAYVMGSALILLALAVLASPVLLAWGTGSPGWLALAPLSLLGGVELWKEVAR